MMMLVSLLALATTVWVWFDAADRDFGGDKFADSRAKWVVGCFLFWVLIFPLYLTRRGRYPRGGGSTALAGWAPPVAVSPVPASPVAVGTSVPPPATRFSAPPQ